MEFEESQVRRFLTMLFITRAHRLLARMAEIYDWSPATLSEHEARFIKTPDFIPIFN